MKVFVLFALALTLVQACEDQSEYCADWKLSGWCEEYKDHLKESCARTCGFCGGSSGGGGGASNVVAVDNRPAREPRSPDFCTDACATGACEWYKTADHCTKFSAVMVENCARTCGWCGAATCSPPVVDNGWTDFENTKVPAGAVVNVNCYEGFKSYGASSLTCNSYGEFDGSASCVKPDDSSYGARETECQRAAKSAQSESFKDGEYVVPQESTHYVPQCDTYEGNYKQIQYDGGKGESFCVDTYRGSEIEGTRINGKHEYIGCTRDSAKEYYARIAAEVAAANPAPAYEEPYYAPEPVYEEPYYAPEPEYNDYYEAPAEPAYDPWAYDTTAEDAWAEESWDQAGDSSFDSDSYYDESAGDDYGYYETRYYDAGADADADAVVPEEDAAVVEVVVDVSEQTLDEGIQEGELFDFNGELFADSEADAADIEDMAVDDSVELDLNVDVDLALVDEGGLVEEVESNEPELEVESEGELVDFSVELFTEGDESDEILQDIIDNVDADSEDKVESAADTVYYADAGAEAAAEDEAAAVDAVADAEAVVDDAIVPLRWKRAVDSPEDAADAMEDAAAPMMEDAADAMMEDAADAMMEDADTLMEDADAMMEDADAMTKFRVRRAFPALPAVPDPDPRRWKKGKGRAKGRGKGRVRGKGKVSELILSPPYYGAMPPAVPKERILQPPYYGQPPYGDPSNVVKVVTAEDVITAANQINKVLDAEEAKPAAPLPVDPGVYVQYKEPAIPEGKLHYQEFVPEVPEFEKQKPEEKLVFNYKPEIRIVMSTQTKQEGNTGGDSGAVELGTVLDTVQKQKLPGLCIDKVRPDLCRGYAKRKWCTTELKYMQHFCVETCEMCHELGLVKPEQFTKVSAEDREKQKAERKKQQEELKKQIEEESLKCKPELKECKTELEIKKLVGGQWVVLSPEEAAEDAAQTALFENYKPEEDPACKDLQYDFTCTGHKERGQCQNKPFYMLQNCIKTCEMCAPVMCSVPNDIQHGYTDPGMPVPPGFRIFISCEDTFYLLGRGTLECEKSGFYSPGGECVKVDEKLLYMMSQCQREKYRKSQPVMIDEVGWIIPEYEVVPECDTRGEYLPMQCNRCCCFCVNLSGKEIKDTRFTHASGKRPDCTPFEYNKRPADKYFPSERRKGKLYGRNDGPTEFDNYNQQQRYKRFAGYNENDISYVETDSLSCTDVSSQCQYLAEKGQCQSNPPYMMKFCPRTCNTCPKLHATKSCDDVRENCAAYVSAGYCSFYAVFMEANCARSCGYCDQDTVCETVELDNGRTFPEATIAPTTIVQLACDQGYVLEGSPRLRCQSNGEYDTSPGTCIKQNRPAELPETMCTSRQRTATNAMYNNHFAGYVLPLGAFVPQCGASGEFEQIQCYDGNCFCLDVVSSEQGVIKINSTCNDEHRVHKRSVESNTFECEDLESERCSVSVLEDPLYCTKYPGDATTNCRQSCGLCRIDGSAVIHSCPAMSIDNGFVEPYHALLPGNRALVYCENMEVTEVTCQNDGSYYPAPTQCRDSLKWVW